MKESKQNKYIVKWQEIVTYEVEIEADNKDEAQYLSQENYGYDDEVDSDYWEGSMQIEQIEQIEKEQD